MTTETRSPTTRPWRGAATGIGIALGANLVIFLAGNAVIGGSVQVVAAGATTASDLRIAELVGASIVPLLLAAAALWLMSRARPASAYRPWQGIVAIVTILSMAGPLMLAVSTGSKAVLILMHIATGAAAVIGQDSASRSS